MPELNPFKISQAQLDEAAENWAWTRPPMSFSGGLSWK